MVSKIIKRCFSGAVSGLAVYVMFTLFASWVRADGSYYFASGHMILSYGSELNAVSAACGGAAVLGALWASAALIYRETDWSIPVQTALHILICIVPSLLLVRWLNWMPRSMDGFMQYARLFGILYILLWLGQYLMLRSGVRQLNDAVEAAEK